MAICPKYQGTMCSGYISISCDLVVDVTEDVQTSWIAANHMTCPRQAMIVRIIQDISLVSGSSQVT